MKEEVYESVWDAIESDPAEAASLKARSSLLIAIQETVKGWALPAAATAKRLGLTQVRLKDLHRGNIESFSLDELVRLAAVAGLSVTLDVVRSAA